MFWNEEDLAELTGTAIVGLSLNRINRCDFA